MEGVDASRPHLRPPSIGWTVFVRPTEQNATVFAELLKQTWRVVASWGRWSDENLGDWPSNDACLAMLPNEVGTRIQQYQTIDAWLDDVHDRQWVVWSIAAIDDQVKVDMSSDALPLSDSPLRSVVAALGGRIVWSDMWTSTSVTR